MFEMSKMSESPPPVVPRATAISTPLANPKTLENKVPAAMMALDLAVLTGVRSVPTVAISSVAGLLI